MPKQPFEMRSTPPTLDLRRLRVLQAVARCKSFSAAARALDYTQPAIGHHVRRLEAELGTPLVIRRGRIVDLTPAGAALAQRADVLLAGATAAAEEVAAVAGLRAGRVRLAAFPSAGGALVPPALALVRARHPEMEVTLVEAEPPALAELIRRGDADVAVSFEYAGLDGDADSDLDRTELCVDEKLAVLPAGHQLAAEAEVRLEELAGERFIAGCPRCRGHLVSLCRAAGFEPDIALATDDSIAVQAMVAGHLGVTLLPALVLDTVRHPDVRILPVRGRPTRTVSALTLRDGGAVPGVRALVDALAEEAARRPRRLEWVEAPAEPPQRSTLGNVP
jgi:DNA-binding transcriptional LysR family regulator